MSEPRTPPAWEQVKPLLAQILELPASQQRARAALLAGDDLALREELLSLLDTSEHDHALLKTLSPELALQAIRSELDKQRDRQFGQPLVGQRVGTWRLNALIARGGQGDVYRAERADGQFEQQVAIKLLRSRLDDEGFVARFAAERQILASLDHPNLARVLDGGTTDDGNPYFVMELVEGESIDRYCERMALPLTERLALFRTVCQVVGYAHSKGIVHRDLKCDNILVTPAGVVKLVDFGIAKQLSVPTETTATAQRMMTLAYCSPEQLRGGSITPASDVYSLGVVLYKLLTDSSPYAALGADSGYELTRAICDTEPPPPSRADATTRPALTHAQRRRLRGDLDALVMMALRKEPARRYPDGQAFGDDVFRHLENLPVIARRGAWSYRFNRYVLRHRAVVGAAMIANLALLIGLGMAIYGNIEANRQRERAEHHLAKMREFANVLIFDMHDAIQDLPGATPARLKLVKTAVAYLQELNGADGTATDPSLLVELASGWRKVGEIQGGPLNSNLGDPKAANQSFDQSIALASQALTLHATAAQHSTARRELALVSRVKAILMSAHGDYQGAVARLEAGIAAMQEELKVSPNDTPSLRTRAGLQASLAQTHQMHGNGPAFIAASEVAIQQLEALVAANPDDVPAGGSLASAYGIHGDYFINNVRTPEGFPQAEQHFRKAIDVLEKLLVKSPQHTGLLDNLAVSYDHLGVSQEEQGQHAAALASHRRSVAIIQPMVARDPDNTMLRHDLAAFTSGLSESLRANEQFEESVAQARTALAEFSRVPEAQRDELVANLDFAQAHYNLGKALLGLANSAARPSSEAGRTPRHEACANYQTSLGLLDKHEKKFGAQSMYDTHITEIRKEMLEAMKGCK